MTGTARLETDPSTARISAVAQRPWDARQLVRLDLVPTDRPVYMHGGGAVLEAAARWLTSRGVEVRGYVDSQPPLADPQVRPVNHLLDIPTAARVYIYGAGRNGDGQRLCETLHTQRPDVVVLGMVDDEATATSLSSPVPTLRPADFVGNHLPYDLFVVASSQHGPAMLARAASLGISRMAVLRFGFALGGHLSYPLDWVLVTNQPAAFVLGPDARPEVWASLEQAGVPEVYSSALWTLINHPHPLSCDRDLLFSLTADHGSADGLLQTLGNFPTVARLLLPLVNEPLPVEPDVPERLKPILESVLARRARIELLAAPEPFVAWFRHVAAMPGPTNSVMQVHAVRTARHLGEYRLAAALLDCAPATEALRAERAGTLLDLGQFDAAFPLLRELHEETPSNADVAYLAAGTAGWLERNGRATGWPALPSLVQRLVSEADAARQPVSADRLDEHLTRYGFGVVRGALSAAALQALLAAYRRFLQTLTAEQQQALTTGLEVTQEQSALIHQSLSDGGVLGAIARFLGSDPRYFASASFNRWRDGAPNSGLCVFHQDGRIGNRLTREVTCWLPLVACGERLPGLDLIARRFFGFFPLGDGHFRAHRQSSHCPNDLAVEGTTWSPVFSPGDVVVFEKFTPHRTQPMTADQLEGDGRRFSMDLRWFSDQNV